MSKPPITGGVVLGSDDPFKGLPAEVRNRVAADFTALALMAEAKSQLARAGGLLAADLGHWVDVEGNTDLAARIEVALKILDGGTNA